MRSVLALILGGGAGTRLHPLTESRSKPAVPFGGKYRLIDVPISNCLNSAVNRIYVLTQYNSASLHHHVSATYRFSHFSRGFVDILAAEQTPHGERWFQGTADAVRQVLHHLEPHAFERVLVLSGDQLYRLDFKQMLSRHLDSRAAASVATIPVRAEEASAFGILQCDASGRIRRFVEKPPPDRLTGLESAAEPRLAQEGRVYLASMGIYCFEREVLFRLLQDNPDSNDFGRDILPLSIAADHVQAFPFEGYWTDIGSIGPFFDANLMLTDAKPAFDLHDPDRPLFTRPRMLPPSRLDDAHLEACLVAPGCRLHGCRARRTIFGVRAVVGRGAALDECVVMGADMLEFPHEAEAMRARGVPPLGVGAGSVLERVIVDKGARIGRDVVVRGAVGRPDEDGEQFAVRDGIVVLHKNAVLRDGTTI